MLDNVISGRSMVGGSLGNALLNGVRKFRRLTIGHYHGAPIRWHWTALVLGVGVILMGLLGGWQILALGGAYFALLIIHEIGHAFLAEHFKREVLVIDIYFVIGVCSYEYYDDPYEESVIAWGGILAQLILFIPALLGLFFRVNLISDVFNAILVMFSYFNVMLIIINLAPAKGLDGYKAWGVVRHLHLRNKKSWY